MENKFTRILSILLITLIPTLLIWSVFFFRFETFWKIPIPKEGMATVVSNYDGPLYIVVAKTFYEPEKIKELISFPLPNEYYPAHFPLYPFTIRILSVILGYPYAMLISSVFFSFLAIYLFYLLSKNYVDGKNIFWLVFVFSLFPARWLIVRSVGSSEPLFISLILASVLSFQKKKYFWAGVWGALAQLTKSPGILLFFAYFLSIFIPNIKELANKSVSKVFKQISIAEYWPLLFIPVSIILLFYFYFLRTGNFFAYFASGDNIHLFFPPFQIFNYSSPWVGTFWQEEVIFVYLLSLLGLANLIREKNYLFASFLGVFFLSIIFVSHRDIIRYSLPMVPFLIISFRNYIVSKEFKAIFLFLIIPIFLFSIAFIAKNAMPIPDWKPLL